MNNRNKLTKYGGVLLMAAGLLAAGCQKMDRPALGNYAKDTNPPGGPLKFYAALDGTTVDSIRANFGTENNVTYKDGVLGKAMDGTAGGYISYGSANDFNASTSFTVAFWMKKAGPNAAGGGTSFVFGLATKTDIWTHQDMFLEFEDAGNPSSADSAAAKFYVNDQWFEFTGAKRMPKVLDGQWHHLAFSFDEKTAMLTTYIDGKVDTNIPADFGKFTNNGGKINMTNVAGLVIGAPGHFAIGKTPDSWMGNFNGMIDQFRLYGTALSASDVAALYANKM